TNFGDMQELL
ncbi:hypothetical protein MK560_04015, partial [Streptococcus gallolyticus subsp. gallolyticus]|nr:hypothetical protein [Streptococcus gallolyticus subsp. gallolyticus]